MRTRLIILLSMVSLLSAAATLKEGSYRAVLVVNEIDNTELPFNFEVIYKKKKPAIIIRNGEEKILVDEIKIAGDSVFIKMPVFDTEFRCVMKGNDLEGVWINHYRKEKNILKFSAKYGETKRFDFVPGKSNPYFEGKWEVTFSPGSKDSSKAIGIFHHIEQTDYLTGTFLTETGDYRYLEGMKSGNKLYLSCFDGSHAFLFIGKLFEGSLIQGTFYSGLHWQESWFAVRNPDFKLKNPDEITIAKNPNEAINLSFTGLDKKTVSLNDKRFLNKPLILQVMGSWCPNCMDESRYLSEVYESYKGQGLEIVALAFEKTTDFEKAKAQVLRMKERLKIKYTVLLTLQTGKEKASESLAFVNKISAFPTTIFLNKEHKVVKITTGFNGPATGNEYLSFKESTEALIRKLIKE